VPAYTPAPAREEAPISSRIGVDLGPCAGKANYLDKAAALKVIKHRSKRHSGVVAKNGRGGITPYRCHKCGSWHIGSSSLRVDGKWR
jgi:hypothetical protein